jgi:hypothetical protein
MIMMINYIFVLVDQEMVQVEGRMVMVARQENRRIIFKIQEVIVYLLICEEVLMVWLII